MNIFISYFNDSNVTMIRSWRLFFLFLNMCAIEHFVEVEKTAMLLVIRDQNSYVTSLIFLSVNTYSRSKDQSSSYYIYKKKENNFLLQAFFLYIIDCGLLRSEFSPQICTPLMTKVKIPLLKPAADMLLTSDTYVSPVV